MQASPKKTYRIGTRGSLLAVTQTKILREELQEKTGDLFEIITIKTQGDLNTSVPLWQLDGKDFFTKELDDALLKKEIDLVIHSYKDLGSIRPTGIKLAAITKRKFANDIFLIPKKNISKLSQSNDFIIGTSSPRRIENIESSLAPFLKNNDQLKINTKMLRGNVNTRIKKLKDGEFDAIILAMAGLERLASWHESKKELTELLTDLTFLILPQKLYPSSASQGALGVECHEDNNELINKLKLVNDENTQEEVARERKIFNEFGGGCHLAVGINVKKVHDTFLHSYRGKSEQSIQKYFLENRNQSNFPSSEFIFIGTGEKKLKPNFIYDQLIKKTSTNHPKSSEFSQFFVTTKYTIPYLNHYKNEPIGIWAAGNKTLKELLNNGLWAFGSAEGLGENLVKSYLESNLVKLFCELQGIKTNLAVLSNETATSKHFPVLSCYERKIDTVSNEFKEKINKTKIFFWASFYQYKTYCLQFPELNLHDRVHTCGIGKTYQEFLDQKISVMPIPDLEQFISLF